MICMFLFCFLNFTLNFHFIMFQQFTRITCSFCCLPHNIIITTTYRTVRVTALFSSFLRYTPLSLKCRTNSRDDMLAFLRIIQTTTCRIDRYKSRFFLYIYMTQESLQSLIPQILILSIVQSKIQNELIKKNILIIIYKSNILKK